MGTAPTLNVLTHAFGDDAAESWLEIQLTDLSEFSGCKEKLDARQAERLAKVIMTMFGFYKVTELMYFFMLFKSGKFGKFYGIVDGMAITTALQQFRGIRNNMVAQFYDEEMELRRIEMEDAHARRCLSYDEWQDKMSADL